MNKNRQSYYYFFSDRNTWQHILSLFAATRVLLILVAWFTSYFEGNVIYQRYIDQGFFLSPHWLIDIWCRWDSEWQLSIAKWGYNPPADLTAEYSNLAFFPLYPYLIRLLTFWLPESLKDRSVYLLVGLIISNLSLLFGLYGLSRFVRRFFDDKTAVNTVSLIFCLPCAFYFSTFYSEALFFCLTVYAFMLAEEDHWLISAIFTALAALTRPHGVLLLLPIIWIYMSRCSWNIRKIGTAWLWYLLVPLGICGYFFGMYLLTGDFFAFFKAQSSWGRSLSDTSAWALYFEPLHTRHNRPTTIDLCMISISLILSVWMLFRMKDKEWGIYSLACTLILIGTGNLYSMMRYTAVNFPIWTFAASLLKKQNRVFLFICALFSVFQVLLFCGWINYYWIA